MSIDMIYEEHNRELEIFLCNFIKIFTSNHGPMLYRKPNLHVGTFEP